MAGARKTRDRNVVLAKKRKTIFIFFLTRGPDVMIQRFPVARCTFWIVRSFCVCVCACDSVRILDRKKFAVAQADTPFEEESGLQC